MDYAIEMNNITKTFGNFKANDDITIKLKKGEIHAILGENGAGKSTLMSILFGLYKADKGEIKVNGQVVKINNPNEANALGIGMIHQHFKLVHNFTILENIILGKEDTKFGFLQLEKARKKIEDLCEKYNFNLNLDECISKITVGMQQKVEILKTLYYESDILIFDEPTAVLTPQEISEFMKIMKQLIAEGKSIIFITHKLNEIKAIADRCTILRKGKFINTIDVSSTTKEEMSEMMIGRKVNLDIEKKPSNAYEKVLEINNLTINSKNNKKNIVNNVSFDVKKGEIVCIAGIDGNGQSELVYGITGLMPINKGSIILNGKDITKYNTRQKNLAGIAHIPEDRHKYGLVLDFSLQENLVLKNYFDKEFQNKGFLKFAEIRNYAKKLISKFDIRSANGEHSIARGMSGGNQQKAIIAREIDQDPNVIIAVQPVRGLDVGSIEYIYSQFLEQRDMGKGILLVSFELEEVMNLADRILVMFEGEIIAEVNPKEVSMQELGLYMSGNKRGVN